LELLPLWGVFNKSPRSGNDAEDGRHYSTNQFS
jgi:hypothetical protein